MNTLEKSALKKMQGNENLLTPYLAGNEFLDKSEWKCLSEETGLSSDSLDSQMPTTRNWNKGWGKWGK